MLAMNVPVELCCPFSLASALEEWRRMEFRHTGVRRGALVMGHTRHIALAVSPLNLDRHEGALEFHETGCHSCAGRALDSRLDDWRVLQSIVEEDSEARHSARLHSSTGVGRNDGHPEIAALRTHSLVVNSWLREGNDRRGEYSGPSGAGRSYARWVPL